MAACTFFGHRDCYDLDREKLYDAIQSLINQGVDTFYVGNQGRFDAQVRSTLRQITAQYPRIRYAVVLARLPAEKREGEDFSDTMYPEGLEGHPKYAIERRNRWLVREADYVICYVRDPWGGAYKFARLAQSYGKTVINLCPGGVLL